MQRLPYLEGSIQRSFSFASPPPGQTRSVDLLQGPGDIEMRPSGLQGDASPVGLQTKVPENNLVGLSFPTSSQACLCDLLWPMAGKQ